MSELNVATILSTLFVVALPILVYFYRHRWKVFDRIWISTLPLIYEIYPGWFYSQETREMRMCIR